MSTLRALTVEFLALEAKIQTGGGAGAIARQHEKGRLTARERIQKLVDPGTFFQECGLWAAYEMYKDHGGAPAAGAVTGIGVIQGRRCMIIANDATVKAGAFFPMTAKKIIRAQNIAMMARLPLVYLVDSAGVYLPLQEEIFPDTDDFGRVFRNNAVASAMGVPQIAAIMGFCVAGGGYLPVLCDTLLMTEGSGLYLAGPALVKAAIGQEVSDEELGGAEMHAQISGTIDFREKDDHACIERIRSLVAKYQVASRPARCGPSPHVAPDRALDIFTDKPGAQFDVRDLIACWVDSAARRNPEGLETLTPDFDEYKAEYGQSIVCGYATIGGHPCGIVANQKKTVQRTMPGGKAGPSKSVQMPGVIYDDASDKAARFILDCNQRKIPLVFVHDTTGFMVGRDSEQGGIIKAGAKMVNAMANSTVPKIVLITGGSYGAGNYAMCGRAFDQFLALAWPSAKFAVMGANQATGTLATIEAKGRERRGEVLDADTKKQIYTAVHASYTEQADIRHGAARGWVDRIIEPARTRDELAAALAAADQGWDYSAPFSTGVLQV
ncbi:MAG: acyl-CoA carboxylase subunit beta [Phycisphaerales bacterium]